MSTTSYRSRTCGSGKRGSPGPCCPQSRICSKWRAIDAAELAERLAWRNVHVEFPGARLADVLAFMNARRASRPDGDERISA